MRDNAMIGGFEGSPIQLHGMISSEKVIESGLVYFLRRLTMNLNPRSAIPFKPGHYPLMAKLVVRSLLRNLSLAKSHATHYHFLDSLVLRLGDEEMVCDYLGAAHTIDNIVVWIPSERILFAGCMVKETSSQSLGNTADGDLAEYPQTIRKVLEKYRDARFVIPGHGKFGGVELLEHTLALASRH